MKRWSSGLPKSSLVNLQSAILHGRGSIGRAPVSKTGGWGFESLRPCINFTISASMRDPEKVKAARRRWYERNREHAKAKVTERKRRIAQKLQAYKLELGCAGCGELHPAVLDFHHLVELRDSDPHTRVFNLVWRQGWGWERLIDYLNQECAVLCANCHRKRHWLSQGEVPVVAGSSPAARAAEINTFLATNARAVEVGL